MIVVTGGAGFIGSAFIWKLNSLGIEDILVVDELGGGFGVVALGAGDVASQEHQLVFAPEGERPDRLAHAELGHHASRQH